MHFATPHPRESRVSLSCTYSPLRAEISAVWTVTLCAGTQSSQIIVGFRKVRPIVSENPIFRKSDDRVWVLGENVLACWRGHPSVCSRTRSVACIVWIDNVRFILLISWFSSGGSYAGCPRARTPHSWFSRLPRSFADHHGGVANRSEPRSQRRRDAGMAI
jgi:hypothetical protein